MRSMTSHLENELFEKWQADKTLERHDGVWFLTYPDGGEIELSNDPKESRPFIVTIGNTCEVFRSRHAAEWHLWDNWSECNYL